MGICGQGGKVKVADAEPVLIEPEALEPALIEDDGAPAGAIGHAVMHGPDSREWQAALAQEFTFTTGQRQFDHDWQPVTRTWGAWLDQGHAAGNRGLAFHRNGKKDGRAIVLAEMPQGPRKAERVQAFTAIGLDCDYGQPLAEIIAAAEKAGLACLIYTTHSHMTTEYEVTRDALVSKLKITREPTIEEIRANLTESDRLSPEIIASAEISIPEREGKIVLRVAPIPKARLIFPLAAPVQITALGHTGQARKTEWKANVAALAASMGIRIDMAATTIERLFYLPRHRVDGAWEMHIIRGGVLRFEDVRALPRVSGNADLDPFAVAGRDENLSELKGWVKHFGDSIQMADLIEDRMPDMVKADRQRGGVFITCPYVADHSDTPEGTFVVNAEDGGFVWYCSHNGCSHRNDRLAYVQEALRLEWFTKADLIDPAYLGGYALGADAVAFAWSDADDDDSDETDEDPDNAGADAEDSAALDDIAGCNQPPEGEYEDRADWLIGYKVTGGRITYKKNGKPVPLCGVFDVVGRSSNADGTEAAGRIISFANENGKRVELTLLMADLVTDGRTVIARLAGAGLPIYTHTKEGHDNLLALLRSITPKRLVPTMQAPGWVRGDTGDVLGYLAPSGDYIRAVEDAPAVRLVETARAEVVKPGGTLAGWQGAADAAIQRASENPYWLLTLCAGFAGPLLGLTRADPCGLALSGRTSKGKSLAQRLGASVWASPRTGDGVLHSMNSTSNAIEDLATKGSEAVLMLDDVGALQDKRALSGILFGLSGGSTKNRKAGRGAGLTKRESFRPYVVLSSEQDIRAEVMGAGDTYRGGLAGRFADVDVTNGQDAEPKFLAALEAVSQHYGHAGPAFIQHLIATGVHIAPERLAAKVKDEAGKLAKRGLDAGQESPAVMRRAAEAFAYPLLGGLLAVEAGLIGGEDKARAEKAVRAVVENAWDGFVETGGAGVARGGADLIDSFRSFIARELGGRIIETGDDASTARGGVIGWQNADYIYLDWALLADPARLGIDFAKRDELAKALDEAGMLVKPPKGYPQRKLPMAFSAETGEKDPREVKNLKIIRKTLGI